jgi:hypothetical protein
MPVQQSLQAQIMNARFVVETTLADYVQSVIDTPEADRSEIWNRLLNQLGDVLTLAHKISPAVAGSKTNHPK